MRPARAVASFDSATGMLRSLARYLHGRDVPALGSAPAFMEPVLAGLFTAANHLPRRVKENLYSWSGWSEAVPARRLGDVRAEAVAEWIVGHYPQRRYPAIIIGSSNGAAIHLAAALGVPWLPQTLLLPVRLHGLDPDEPIDDMGAAIQPARALLDANPKWTLHHMHDANQDRLMIRHMSYFRVKWTRLASSYRRFITDCLEPGGTVIVMDCGVRWPVTHVADRHVFQHGALGGATVEEYQAGSDRVTDYLKRYDSDKQRWQGPPPDGDAPEAEWGFEPQLADDVALLVRDHGYRLRRLSFTHPEDLSPLVAELHREWYRRRGVPTGRLLIESFLLMEPWWALRTASVPFWTVFNTEPSRRAAEDYLDDAESTEPYDEIRLLLFSHGVDSVGLAGVEQWRRLASRARKVGTLVGVDDDAYPRDFASLIRGHRELAATRARYPMPGPLPLEDVDVFLRQRTYPAVTWVEQK